MQRVGIGTTLGSQINTIKDKVYINNHLFNTGIDTISLEPGLNVLQMYIMKNFVPMEDILIYRKITKPIPISYSEAVSSELSTKGIIKIVYPSQGYLSFDKKGVINFKAKVTKSLSDNIYLLQFQKVSTNSNELTQEITMPVIDGYIQTQVTLIRPGTYVFRVISPKYISSSGGGVGRAVFAKFYTDIK